MILEWKKQKKNNQILDDINYYIWTKKHHCITQTKTQWSVEYDKNITVL